MPGRGDRRGGRPGPGRDTIMLTYTELVQLARSLRDRKALKVYVDGAVVPRSDVDARLPIGGRSGGGR